MVQDGKMVRVEYILTVSSSANPWILQRTNACICRKSGKGVSINGSKAHYVMTRDLCVQLFAIVCARFSPGVTWCCWSSISSGWPGGSAERSHCGQLVRVRRRDCSLQSTFCGSRDLGVSGVDL